MCGLYLIYSWVLGYGKVISSLRLYGSRRGYFWCRWVVGIGVCELGVLDSVSCVGRLVEKRLVGRCSCG